MIRVLLADDQALVRTGFRLILQQAPDMRVIRFCFAKKEATLDAALQRLQALQA